MLGKNKTASLDMLSYVEVVELEHEQAFSATFSWVEDPPPTLPNPPPTLPKYCEPYHRRLMGALAPATEPLGLQNEH